jgi:uncharacterized membrane protein
MNPVSTDVVPPAESDPVVAAATERFGGPAGEHRGRLASIWTPLRVLVVLAATAYTFGYLTKLPCHAEGFGGDARYTRLCYSDIPFLYSIRGFADGWLPYVQTGPGQGPALEYPVLTGLFMQVASWLTGRNGSAASRSLAFYDWNVLLLFGCLLVTVVCTALTVRRRPWDAALVALAPGVILCAVINWDLLAVALTAGSMLAWSRKRLAVSGVLLGLAVAAKFYPVLLIPVLLLLCLRAGRMRAFWSTTGWAVLAWTAVNLPIFAINHDGWSDFYSFSSSRGADWGSIWYVLQVFGEPVAPDSLNAVATGVLVVLFALIAALALMAPRRPRYAQLAFLAVAAFCLTNKVYSPQYVLWLIPLAALARPRWRDFLIWQTGEALYFGAIWYFLQQYGTDDKGLPYGWYVAAVLVHMAATAFFAVMVVRDVLAPEHDPIRSDGVPDHEDDPGGGVLDAAPETFPLRRLSAALGRHARWIPWGLGGVVSLSYGALSLTRFASFTTPSWDLGIFTQVVARYAALQTPVSDIKGPGYNILGDHFSPVDALLALPYRIASTPVTLLVAQALLVGLSVVPVTRVAMSRLGALAGLVVGVAYGLSWGLQNAVAADFHEIAFAVPLLAFAIEAYLERRWVRSVAFAAPLVLVKEDLGLTVAVLGVLLVFAGQRRLGALTAVGGVLATAITMLVVIPSFNAGHEYAYAGNLSGSSGSGLSVSSVTTLLTDPLSIVTPVAKTQTLLLLLLVTAGAALRSPVVLLAVPTLAWRFSSTIDFHWGPTQHYSAVLMPIVFLALVDGVVRLRASTYRGVRVYARLVVPLVAGAAAAMLLVLPLTDVVRPSTWLDSSRRDEATAALALIPAGTSVESDLGLISHLVSTNTVYWMTNTQGRVPDYITLDTTSGWIKDDLQSVDDYVAGLHKGVRYTRLTPKGPFWVYRRASTSA